MPERAQGLTVLKILYTRDLSGQDYLCDSIFHGLCQLDNIEITDAPRMWYMYKNEFRPHGIHDLKSLYGKGFTIWGLMDENQIDRTGIEQRIKEHYYDIIILSKIENPSPYFGLITSCYNPSEIISLCGSDSPFIDNNYLKTAYFKREFTNDYQDVFSISFSFPREKIQTSLEKTQPWSRVQPTQGIPYIYDNEQDYYDDYRKSLFGATTKKGGWDCMRHYEIMACRAIPYFENLELAPARTMTTLPKDLLLLAKQRVDQMGAKYFMPGQLGWEEYQDLEQRIHEHFVNHCTTDRVAEYIIKTHQARISR